MTHRPVPIDPPPESEVTLSVIVLFYNGNQWVRACVESLLARSLPNSDYELLLVDNGDTTDAIDAYQGRGNVRIVRFEKNLGFAGGNNAALAHARAPWVLLLNQDTVIHERCLKEMVDTCQRHPEAGSIAANMVMVSHGNEANSAAPAPAFIGHYRLSRLGFAVYETPEVETDTLPVDFVSGNGMCLNKAALESIGGFLFDPMLGSYMEDMDLSFRMRKAGRALIVCRKAVVYHFRDASLSGSMGGRVAKFVHISTNRLLVNWKFLGKRRFLGHLPLLLAGIPLKVLRLDTDTRPKPLRSLAAIALIPIVVVYFALRLLSLYELQKELTPGSAATASRTGRSRLQIAILIVFTVLTGAFLLEQDWGNVAVALVDLPWAVLSILIGLTFAVHLVTAWRTRTVLFRLGHEIRVTDLLAINSVSLFSAIITPAGMGGLFSVPLFKSLMDVPLRQSTIYVLTDRLFALYATACFALVGVAGYVMLPGAWWPLWALLLVILSGAFFQVVRIGFESIDRFGVPNYGGTMLCQLAHDRTSQSAIVFSLLFRFGINVIQYLFLLRALGVPVTISMTWMIVAVSIFIGVLSMIPLGLVTLDASLLVLSTMSGIPASIRIAAVVGFRAVTSLPTVFLGMLSGLWIWKRHGEHDV